MDELNDHENSDLNSSKIIVQQNIDKDWSIAGKTAQEKEVDFDDGDRAQEEEPEQVPAWVRYMPRLSTREEAPNKKRKIESAEDLAMTGSKSSPKDTVIDAIEVLVKRVQPRRSSNRFSTQKADERIRAAASNREKIRQAANQSWKSNAIKIGEAEQLTEGREGTRKRARVGVVSVAECEALLSFTSVSK